MATIQKFEDLEVWQKARELNNHVRSLRLAFINALTTAKGETGELKLQLYRRLDIGISHRSISIILLFSQMNNQDAYLIYYLSK